MGQIGTWDLRRLGPRALKAWGMSSLFVTSLGNSEDTARLFLPSPTPHVAHASCLWVVPFLSEARPWAHVAPVR